MVSLLLGKRYVNECPGLEGVVEMLDEWSDKRYFSEGHEMKEVKL